MILLIVLLMIGLFFCYRGFTDYLYPHQNKLHYRELAEFESNIIDIMFCYL